MKVMKWEINKGTLIKPPRDLVRTTLIKLPINNKINMDEYKKYFYTNYRSIQEDGDQTE